VFVTSFGFLGLGGVAAFIAGALILIDTELPGFGIPIGLIVAVAVTSALLVGAIAGLALRSRRRPLYGGPEALIGSPADMVGDGWARLHGENWRVTSSAPLQPAQKVRVVARQAPGLEVKPMHEPGPFGNHDKGEGA